MNHTRSGLSAVLHGARYSPSGRLAATLIQSALRRGAMSTARLRVPFDFVIIGAKRGGTTSLWRYLLEHPGVTPLVPRAANVKGTYFLADEWRRGETWWRSHPPTRWSQRRRARVLGYTPVVGEASPYYLHHPLAPQRAASLLDEHTTFIVSLRDPVERAHSHYRERRANRTEPLSFADAVAAEGRRLDGEERRLVEHPGQRSFAHRHQGYVAQSHYAEALRRWFDAVGRDRVHIVVAEEMFARPQATVDAITDRLGLPRSRLRDATAHNREASTGISDGLRAQLTRHVRVDIEATEALIGRDLPWARPPRG